MKKFVLFFVSCLLILCLSMTVFAKPVISKKRLSLSVGKDYKLTVSGYDGAVKWSSSKKAVAKVSGDGTVIARKVGKAKITAKCGKKKLTCTVKVTPVKIESVKLDVYKLSLRKGGSFKMKYTIYPSNASDKKVTWKSSNPKVVSVDNKGNLKAHKLGNAVITVITKNGRKKHSCEVTVKSSGLPNISYTKDLDVSLEPASRIPFPSFPSNYTATGQYSFTCGVKFDAPPEYTMTEMQPYGAAHFKWVAQVKETYKPCSDIHIDRSTADKKDQGFIEDLLNKDSYRSRGLATFILNDEFRSGYIENDSFQYKGHQVYVRSYIVPEFNNLSTGHNPSGTNYWGGATLVHIVVYYPDVEAPGYDWQGAIRIRVERQNMQNCTPIILSRTDIMNLLSLFIFPDKLVCNK